LRRLRLVVTCATGLAICGACGSSEIRRIEIVRPATFKARLRVGEVLSATDRLAHLRAQVRLRFPAVTEHQLSLLFIGLEVAPDTVPEARRVVALIVGMRYDSQADRRAVVEYATELLRAEVETLEASLQ
jgi:hypothetical protein